MKALEELLLVMRKHGVRRVRMGDVEVELGLPPEDQPRAAPAAEQEPQPEKSKKKGPDGLTEDEAALAYGHLPRRG